LNGMGYPNFRTGRKSFATIEDSRAVIRLTRDQQATFMATAPEVFVPDSSGWGRLGSTVIRLEGADEATVQIAVATAWRNVAEVVNLDEGVNVDGIANVAEVATMAEVVNEAEVVEVADAAEVADVATEVVNETEVADVVDAAEVVNGAKVVEIANEAVNIVPRDDLQSVIDRLQVSWGRGPEQTNWKPSA
jgi:hypothetical protein